MPEIDLPSLIPTEIHEEADGRRIVTMAGRGTDLDAVATTTTGTGRDLMTDEGTGETKTKTDTVVGGIVTGNLERVGDRVGIRIVTASGNATQDVSQSGVYERVGLLVALRPLEGGRERRLREVLVVGHRRTRASPILVLLVFSLRKRKL